MTIELDHYLSWCSITPGSDLGDEGIHLLDSLRHLDQEDVD